MRSIFRQPEDGDDDDIWVEFDPEIYAQFVRAFGGASPQEILDVFLPDDDTEEVE